MRVLILGGTAEARELAGQLQACEGIELVSSLAGRVSRPALPAGEVRIGGFGGVEGLTRYLRTSRTEAVIDATHPFAATISAHAIDASRQVGCPLVLVRRRGWVERPDDRWLRLPTIGDAASWIRDSPAGCVFLTTGRRDLSAFSDDPAHEYLVRVVEPPEREQLPVRYQLILARGPYTVDGEVELMRRHHVRVLVTKDSGGSMTVAKLDAARARELPVLMVDRPPVPEGVRLVPDARSAISWLDTVAG